MVNKFNFWTRDLSDLWKDTRKLLEHWNEGEPWNHVLPLTNAYQAFLHSSYNRKWTKIPQSQGFISKFVMVENDFYGNDFPKNR